MAHTPSPWKVFVSHLNTFAVVTDDSRGAIICDFDRHNKVNNADNARLIAASPTLLEACKKLLEGCELADLYGDLSDHVPGEIMEIARAAITKAEGSLS